MVDQGKRRRERAAAARREGEHLGRWCAGSNACLVAGQTMGKQALDDSKQNPRLFYLDQEIGEQTNLADNHPEVVARLEKLASKMASEIGGKQPPLRRPAGHVDKPQTLYPSEAPNLK